MSWITPDDEVAAIRHVLADQSLRGSVNLTARAPVTNAEFTTTLGRTLGRPTVVPTPTPVLHAMFGREMTAVMLLGRQRVLPAALQASGFAFAHRDMEGALDHVMNG